ncbi:MAG: hypothetical protein LBF22_12055, partial [Deltaproteobacteria bacterium]|nr:hypothetical protein [Deltaproteobacteria bacterium]
MQTPLAPLSFFKAIFLAAGSGVLLSLAFPEINLYPLALVAPLLLFLAIYGQNGKTAFFLGWVQGLWLGVFSLYWLPKVLTVYGALPGWGANLIFLILVSYLALYPATFAWLILPLKPSSGKGALLYPLSLAFLWTGLEWLKNYIFTGFNWTPLSAALGAAPKWLGAADLVGVYGLNFLISFIPFSVGTYLILRFGHVKSPLNPKSLLALVVTPLLVLGFLYGYGSYSYNYWEEKTADYPTHRISLIQASV